jgi:hypothetical protein
MVVYNTQTTHDVSEGIYYCDGSKWIKLSPVTGGNYWSKDGNSVAVSDFLGSVNNAPVIFKTNNNERLRIAENGFNGIGTASPQDALHVNGQVRIDTTLPGSVATDSILTINPVDKKVKAISPAGLMLSAKKLTYTASDGQTNFTTPVTISDINKILLYRNGVLINFTLGGGNSIISEVACVTGDEIQIIQYL